MLIKEVHAREILDSRGNPTVEVDMTLDNNITRASIPIRARRFLMRTAISF